MNIKTISEIRIVPQANSVEFSQDIKTNDYYYDGKFIHRICSQVDYSITGLTTDGQKFTITYHDPKDMRITYE